MGPRRLGHLVQTHLNHLDQESLHAIQSPLQTLRRSNYLLGRKFWANTVEFDNLYCI